MVTEVIQQTVACQERAASAALARFSLISGSTIPKTLVLGGSSFIGRHLVDQLLAHGHEVTVLNRGVTPTELPSGVDRLKADRKNHDALRRVLAGHSFDAILDTSAYVANDVAPIIDMFRDRIAHYVFTSSTAAYVRASEYPVDETAELDRSPEAQSYGANKVKCEDLLMEAHRDYRFPATVLRPSMVYGPHNNIANREFAFFLRLQRNRPVIVPGNGSGLLHDGHVDDLAAAFAAVLGKSKPVGQAYTITGPKAVTCRFYVEALARVVGVEPRIVYVPLDRMRNLRPSPWPYPWQLSIVYDIHKAMTDLDWRPRYSFEEGHRQTYEWFVKSGLDGTMAWDWAAEERVLAEAVTE